MCPICEESVKREGEFCSSKCYEQFHRTVYDLGYPVEMLYLTLTEQPWYGRDHG